MAKRPPATRPTVADDAAPTNRETPMPDTLRSGLVDLMNSLTKVGRNTTDLQQQRDIERLLLLLDPILDDVIAQSINNSTDDFKAAIKALAQAESDAQAAITDIKKVASTIQSATAAAKAVDKVIGLIINLI